MQIIEDIYNEDQKKILKKQTTATLIKVATFKFHREITAFST